MMMNAQIKATMDAPATVEAVAILEQAIAKLGLTPQQQLAAIALLAARQISTFPEDAHASAGEMVGAMVDLGMTLQPRKRL